MSPWTLLIIAVVAVLFVWALRRAGSDSEAGVQLDQSATFNPATDEHTQDTGGGPGGKPK